MRKKFSLFILFFSIFFLLNPNKVFAACDNSAFGGGTGTSGDPWQISTPTHLNNVRDCIGSDYTNNYFKLTDNIDLNVAPYNSGTGWTPIGTGTTTSRFFGNFDGNSKTISNLMINVTSGGAHFGLFGSSAGNIHDLTLSNASVSVTGTTSNVYQGILLGHNSGTVSNITVSGGTVSGTGLYMGGVMGYQISGSSSGLSSSATVSGTYYLGGIVGGIFGGTITSSHNSGQVTGTNHSVGGFVGVISGGASAESSYNTGVVSGGANTGGFIGWLEDGTITTSYSTGNVTGSDNGIGGFFGASTNGVNTISKSFASGNVTATSKWYVGGFGGTIGVSGTTVSDSYATGSVNAGYQIGGFIGLANSGVIVTRCYSVGSVTALSLGSGFIYSTSPTTSDNYWDTQTALPITTANGATGKTTAEMKTQSTFTNWNFSTVWAIDGTSAINNGYPYLRDADSTVYYTLTYSAETGGSLTGSTSQTVISGGNGSAITAVADSGYTFSKWSDDVTENPRTDSSVANNITVSAVFTQNTVSNNNSSNSSSNSSSSNTDSNNSSCNDQDVVKIPEIFQIDTTTTTAKIYFTPVDSNDYYLSFSTNKNAEEHGALLNLGNDGVQSYEVNNLLSNTTYYFKIRGNNGCKTGKWSNIMSAQTDKNTKKYFLYSPVVPNVLSFSTQSSSDNISIVDNKNEQKILETQEESSPSITPTPSPKLEEPLVQKPKKCLLWKWFCW